mgnify:CR=1 FL=1
MRLPWQRLVGELAGVQQHDDGHVRGEHRQHPVVAASALAEARAAGAFVLDVREPDEYTAGHVAGAHHIPLQSVPGKLEELPQGQPVYVICASGGRSLQATDFLRQAGIEAYSVVGGTTAWAAQNREMETGA